VHFVLPPFALVEAPFLEVELAPPFSLAVELVALVPAAQFELFDEEFMEGGLGLGMLVLLHLDGVLQLAVLALIRGGTQFVGKAGTWVGRESEAVKAPKRLAGFRSGQLVVKCKWRIAW
jgi:hypothetical protein